MNYDHIIRPSGPGKGPGNDRILAAPPSMPVIMLNVLLQSFVKPSEPPPGWHPPRSRLALTGLTPDPVVVKQYKRLCGFRRDTGTAVPASYFQALFVGLLGKFITISSFPVNPMGLIHTQQTFELKRPVDSSEPLDLSCSLLAVQPVARGSQIRFNLEISTKGEGVWQGISTFLSKTRKSGKTKKSKPAETPLPVQETFKVPGDIGRRYARVSKDFNPHHLYGFAARLIGFRQPIAHGMWSLARALSGLEARLNLTGPVTVKADFKLPLYIPSRVNLGYTEIKPDGPIEFELRNASTLHPHLKGYAASRPCP